MPGVSPGRSHRLPDRRPRHDVPRNAGSFIRPRRRDRGDWHPTGLPHEDVWFQSADGTKLHGWFVPHPNPKRAILYCHGNGEHVAFNAELAAQLRDSLQASVFLFDYRGYGHSEGRPNEAGCIADGRAAQHWLAERMGIRPNEIVLMGRSLGGAVAVALASENGAQALVLENTFSSMPDVAAAALPLAARPLGHGEPLRLAVADPEVPRPAISEPRHGRHA